MRLGISPLAVVALVALLYVIVGGLANPRTRSIVIGLGALVGLGVMFLWIAGGHEASVPEPPHSAATHQVAPQVIAVPLPPGYLPTGERSKAPAQSPPKNSTPAQTKRPKMTFFAALRQAVIQAWTAPAGAPISEAAEKPAESGQADLLAGAPATPGPGPQPPAWVNAKSKMENGCYTTSVWAGPFTTPLECERRLPEKLQEAVTEYAEISLGPEAAAVRLPDDALKQLVRDTWSDLRPMEIEGRSQEMYSLHAQVVFDAPMQERIQSEAQRLVVGQRVQGATVVVAFVLGILTLAWGSLRLVARRREVKGM